MSHGTAGNGYVEVAREKAEHVNDGFEVMDMMDLDIPFKNEW
jgi:hypothetical protein